MRKYESTPNLYERFKVQPNIGRYDSASLRCATFGLVKPDAWTYTEKIDGTNIRIILSRNLFSGNIETTIKGRNENSQMPGDLKGAIAEMVMNRAAVFTNLLSHSKDEGITLYGEGYGPGIQKNGAGYRQDKGFVLFDIARWVRTVDESAQPHMQTPTLESQYYLPRKDVEDIAENCRLTVAPRVFAGLGIGQVTKRVREGFASKLAQFKDGEREAEGIIAVADGLWHYYDGKLRRLKFKLKTKDFPG